MQPNYPLTPRMNKALSIAQRIAQETGCTYVGTEHLFVALLEVDDPAVINEMLTKMGLSRDEMRVRAREILRTALSRPLNIPSFSLADSSKILREIASMLDAFSGNCVPAPES